MAFHRTERTFLFRACNCLFQVNTYRGQSCLVKCHCTNYTTAMKFSSTFHRNTIENPNDSFRQLSTRAVCRLFWSRDSQKRTNHMPPIPLTQIPSHFQGAKRRDRPYFLRRGGGGGRPEGAIFWSMIVFSLPQVVHYFLLWAVVLKSQHLDSREHLNLYDFSLTVFVVQEFVWKLPNLNLKKKKKWSVPNKVLYGEARPRGLAPNSFIYHFGRKGTPFIYLL